MALWRVGGGRWHAAAHAAGVGESPDFRQARASERPWPRALRRSFLLDQLAAYLALRMAAVPQVDVHHWPDSRSARWRASAWRPHQRADDGAPQRQHRISPPRRHAGAVKVRGAPAAQAAEAELPPQQAGVAVEHRHQLASRRWRWGGTAWPPLERARAASSGGSVAARHGVAPPGRNCRWRAGATGQQGQRATPNASQVAARIDAARARLGNDGRNMTRTIAPARPAARADKRIPRKRPVYVLLEPVRAPRARSQLAQQVGGSVDADITSGRPAGRWRWAA